MYKRQPQSEFSGKAIDFETIEMQLVNELFQGSNMPELFNVVKVDRGMTEKMTGFPAVEVAYRTIDDAGERVMRKVGAILNPDGSLREIRYHVEMK